MDKLQPRAIIFDLGSTLIEYETIPWDELGVECAESGRKYLLSKGYDLPGETEFHDAFAKVRQGYRERALESLVEWDVPTVARQLFERLNIPFDDNLIDAFFDAYYEPVQSRLFVYEDVLETLDTLKSACSVMGLVSNTVFPERAHRGELKRFGVEPFLDFAVFSSSFGLRKPHPDIFHHAINRAGVAPGEAVYVGDRYMEDVEGPTGIGMHAILKVVAKREYPPEMPAADRRIERLADLTGHIQA
ncbi:MAG: hypothetical protein DRP45_01790 [Candidatus Zixiibacteriota bacterium]|nr:MAG: hypothetical protein DRP45_01790 [candidate division Zixibacteria bacterium]